MSSSCAVQGVVKLKREFLDEIHDIYQTQDKDFDFNNNESIHYLFGININEYIQTHFSDKAANGSFDEADFETGYLTFVSGFSSYDLDDFINKVNAISDHLILYIIYENPIQLHNEKVVIKNLNELNQYLHKFNDPNFIESEIPFDVFDKNGTYLYVEKHDYDSSFGFGNTTEYLWEFQKEL